jgi:hypothetical protein
MVRVDEVRVDLRDAGLVTSIELQLLQAVARQRPAVGQACWIWARASAVAGASSC